MYIKFIVPSIANTKQIYFPNDCHDCCMWYVNRFIKSLLVVVYVSPQKKCISLSYLSSDSISVNWKNCSHTKYASLMRKYFYIRSYRCLYVCIYVVCLTWNKWLIKTLNISFLSLFFSFSYFLFFSFIFRL